jgi:hypothetical protein
MGTVLKDRVFTELKAAFIDAVEDYLGDIQVGITKPSGSAEKGGGETCRIG